MSQRLRRTFALAAGLCPALAALGGANDGDAPRSNFQQGADLYRRGDLAGSLASFSKALEEDPKSRRAYAARALTLHALGDAARMREDLREGLSISGGDSASLIARGNARVLAGEPAKALEDFDDAIRRDKRDADAFLGRCRALSAAGSLKTAVNDCTEAVRLDPSLLMAYFDRGCAYYRLGDVPKAIDDMARALRANPRFPLPYALLGAIFAGQGDYQRADKAYSKAVYLHPQYAYAYMGRAAVYLHTDRKELAFRDFNEAVASAPSDYAPYYNRGEASWRLGDKDAAVGDFRKALTTDLRYPPAGVAMGDRLREAGLKADAAAMYDKAVAAAEAAAPPRRQEWTVAALAKRASLFLSSHESEKALRDLDAAIRISSGSAEALAARGNLFFEMGQDSKALSDLDRAVALEPTNHSARMARGRLLASVGKNQAALEDFSAVIQRDPDAAPAYAGRGLLYALGFGDYERALADLSSAERLAPEDPDLYFNLGIVRFKRRDYWKAVEAFGRAAELKPAPAPALRRRAEAYAALGDLTMAIADIRAALTADPKDTSIYVALAGIRLHAHAPEQALKDLAQAAELDPDTFLLRYNLGLAHAMLGHHPQAVREFKRATKLNPNSAEGYAALCRALRLSRDNASAAKACTHALELDPRFGPAYVDRGYVEAARGNFDWAAPDFFRGAELGARHAPAELARSVAHASLRQWRESDAAYRSALDLDPVAHDLWWGFGEKPAGAREYGAAIHEMDKSLKQSSGNAYAHLVRGNALHNAGLFDRAVAEYTKAMELGGNMTAAYLDRCAALAAQQSMDAAEADCRRAVELAPKNPEVHIRLATLLTQREKYRAAAEAAADAVRADPKSPAAYVKAGNARLFLKDIARAQENFSLAVSADSSYPDAYNGLGLCEFRRGNYREAIENFSRAIALDRYDDRYWRNRAAAYTNLNDFSNAASDYESALTVNTDPDMVAEYKTLIKNATARATPSGDESLLPPPVK